MSPRRLPGKGRTFREMPSSESLFHRALRGLAVSSASLGSCRSVLRGVPSARRSVPTSRRLNRGSAEPSKGRIWAEARGVARCSRGAVAPLPEPRPHLGGEVVLEPPQEPGVPPEVHGIAVLQPGLQEAEAAPVDLGGGGGGILVGPGDRWRPEPCRSPAPAWRCTHASVCMGV